MLRLIIILPFLAVLIVFMFFNQDPVPMDFIWLNWKCSVGIFSFLVGIAGFIFGALALLVTVINQWKRTRKAQQQVRELEEQLNDLRARYISLTQQSTTNNSSNNVGNTSSQTSSNSHIEEPEVLTQN